MRARVEILELDSRLLAGNSLGDPSVRPVVVVLPPGYDEQPERRWPLVVVLSGFTGQGLMFLNRSPWVPSLPQRLENMVASGRGRGVILVLPDGFTRVGGSQYVNSSATGRYEDYVVDEIVPFAESRFRVAAGARGVCGKSSGGYGALSLAMRRPGVFQALAAHSGDMYFEYCYLPDFAKAASRLALPDAAASLEEFLAAFEAAPRKKGSDIEVLNILAMACCYSPNPAAPWRCDLPFDPATGEIRSAVWERWLERDPVRMAAPARAALAGLRLLYFDCGSRDEYNLHLGGRIFAARLEALGVPHTYEEFDDGHRDISYRFDTSLPLLDRALWEGSS